MALSAALLYRARNSSAPRYSTNQIHTTFTSLDVIASGKEREKYRCRKPCAGEAMKIRVPRAGLLSRDAGRDRDGRGGTVDRIFLPGRFVLPPFPKYRDAATKGRAYHNRRPNLRPPPQTYTFPDPLSRSQSRRLPPTDVESAFPASPPSRSAPRLRCKSVAGMELRLTIARLVWGSGSGEGGGIRCT